MGVNGGSEGEAGGASDCSCRFWGVDGLQSLTVAVIVACLVVGGRLWVGESGRDERG